MNFEYKEVKVIEGKFDFLDLNNNLLYKIGEKTENYNLDSETSKLENENSVLKEVDYQLDLNFNRIYSYTIINGRIVVYFYAWKYENNIVTIIGKNNKVIKKFQNDGFDSVEVVGQSFTFPGVNFIVVIFKSSSKDVFIYLDFSGSKVITTRYTSYRNLEPDDIQSGKIFYSNIHQKEFMINENNELITDLLIITRNRLLDINNVMGFYFIEDSIKLKLNDLKLEMKSHVPKNITSLSFTADNKNFYYIEKNKLVIAKKESKAAFENILDTEEPISSVISVDAKYICLIYENRIKIFAKTRKPILFS